MTDRGADDPLQPVRRTLWMLRVGFGLSGVAWVEAGSDGRYSLGAVDTDRRDALRPGTRVRDLGLAALAAGAVRPALVNPDRPLQGRVPYVSGVQQVGGGASVPVAGGFIWADRASLPILDHELDAMAEAVRLMEDASADRAMAREAAARARSLGDVVEGIRAILSSHSERECVASLADAAARQTHAEVSLVSLLSRDPVGCAVVAGVGAPAVALVGRSFEPSAGLVGLALRSGATVPTTLRYQSSMRAVLGDGADLSMAPGDPVLVCPVQFGADAIGAIALARGEFEREGAVHGVRTLSEAAALLVHQFRLRERVAHDAMFDGLTGLYNRPALVKHLAEMMAFCRRHDADLSLLMIDADHFKKVNDTYGHLVGDTALRYISDTIRRTLRESDFAGRYGGEEFVVVLPHTPVNGAAIVAERLRALCGSSPVPAGAARLVVTVSIGLASLTPAMRAVEDLFGAADAALYEAKRTGRNKVVVR